MVKVLPEPVTPSSTWCRSPRSSPSDELADGPGLVAGGLEVALDVEGHLNRSV